MLSLELALESLLFGTVHERDANRDVEAHRLIPHGVKELNKVAAEVVVRPLGLEKLRAL